MTSELHATCVHQSLFTCRGMIADSIPELATQLLETEEFDPRCDMFVWRDNHLHSLPLPLGVWSDFRT